MNAKKLFFTMSLLFGLLFSTNIMAQSTCCSKNKKASAKTACCSSASAKSKAGATSGCTPSTCRGAQTKFGEAKVISDLRSSLIALKADMEKSEDPKFDAQSYDINGIVGESDDESLGIIVDQLKQVEDAFAEKLNHQTTTLELPDNKAKQVQYLNARIDDLKQLL